MKHHSHYIQALSFLALIFLTLTHTSAPAQDYRWEGHPFVFVLMTDDGTNCNLGWAEVARDMGFRFTIAVNAGRTFNRLCAQDMHDLQAEGFEIAQHGFSHGFDGVAEDCPIPPRG